MPSQEPFTVALVGGGLTSLTLAIALRKKKIPFKIYEARSSFTELGAGINVGPNSSTALRLIDEDLAKAFFKIARQNPTGKEHVYLDIRLGAPSGEFEDGEVVDTLFAPPTGNTTVGRNLLLQMLAERAGLTEGPGKEDADFNKRVSSYSQDSVGVTLSFSDGTTAMASAVIACDGIHSTIRRLLLGSDSRASKPHFSHTGAYRALLPTAELEKLLGKERAYSSQAVIGPGGYVIYYPTTATTMNIGFWTWRKDREWDEDASWLLPGQGKQMREDFTSWGPAAKGLMDLVLEKEGEDLPFWSAWHHALHPEKFWQGRVALIGDSAHAMPPHAGAGAGQAMEDAFLMSEVLGCIASSEHAASIDTEMQKRIEVAFGVYETIRRPRSQAVLETSEANFELWADLYDNGPISHERLNVWRQKVKTAFEGIWIHDLEADAVRAREMIVTALQS
ncbi:hypothetical protein LTR86_006227 [Recurvomyces mirabilis]|nr:hypothetical protein LTR86_006227 [Recurvomyces mirabilis]